MSVYIFDTELTDRKNGEIIEAASMHLPSECDLASSTDVIPLKLPIGLMSYDRFKPSKDSTFGALAVHHILPEELAACPPSSTFALPSDCEYLIGHSIDTDWQAAGAPLHVKRICTHAMAQWVWPEATGYSQVALIYMLLGASKETRELVRMAHSALHDVMLNKILLHKILEGRPSITRWSMLWEFSEECRVPRLCPLKRWEGVELRDMDSEAINWCLRQHWLDPYFRKGLIQVLRNRYPDDTDDDFHHDDCGDME